MIAIHVATIPQNSVIAVICRAISKNVRAIVFLPRSSVDRRMELKG